MTTTSAPRQRHLVIDFAVVCQELSKVEASSEFYHILDLDEILIDKDDFRDLFYAHGENFGINKKFATETSNIHYISFSEDFRTLQGHKFYLIDKIFEHLEKDLNVSRDCFTPESRIDLTRELTEIETICDIDCCSVMASLPWSHIESIIADNKKQMKATSSVETELQPYLVFSVIFKTPTEGTKDTLVKFTYKIVI